MNSRGFPRSPATARGWLYPLASAVLYLSLLLGFALRVARLSAQSLWNDEGTSIALARLTFPAITAGAAHDIHPPLYYFLLHFWIDIAGDSEFAVRFLSVCAGVILIAVTVRLARDLFSPLRLRGVEAFAAFLSALSAFQLYYSQETRMYIFVALFGALSIWGMLRLLRPSAQWVDALLYILPTLAALYTHYFAPTVVLAENLAFVGWLVVQWRSSRQSRLMLITAARWIVSQVVIGLAFLPWFLYAGNQLTSWPAISETLSLVGLVLGVLAAFSTGIDSTAGIQSVSAFLFGLVFFIGLIPAIRRSAESHFASDRGNEPDKPGVSFDNWSLFLCALWALVPLAFMYIVSLRRPAYNPKFLLLSTPAFILLVARGFSLLSSALASRLRGIPAIAPSIAAALMILVLGAFMVQGVYFDPRLQRDDYRGAISYVNQYATSNDAVVIEAPGQIDVVRYYYRAAAPLFTLPVGRPLASGPTGDQLKQILSFQRNVFAIYWATGQADPEQVVERALAQRRAMALDEWHGNIRLAEYGDLPSPMIPMLAVPVQFAGEIRLAAVDRFGADPVQPGKVVSLQLQWFAAKRPSAAYKVFVHLLDGQGAIAGQRDAEPVNGFRPTTSWNEGDTISDNVGLLIRPGTPPGQYSLIMGLYRETGARLALSTGGDHLDLGTIVVSP